jgi:methionyl-tRNA formyltransferase
MVTPLRVAFFGTPMFAVPTLACIHASGHQVVGVITQPDRPRGRGQQLVPSVVKTKALEMDVPVLQPLKLKDETFLAAFAALRADIGVVAAYGRILGQGLLDTPRLGMINVHASLLPRWRGAAPIHRAVMAGDRTTGITIMRIVQALDAGASIAREETVIGADETSAELEARLAAIGGPLLVAILDRLSGGPVDETPQPDEGVTYASRLERHESQADWSTSAVELHNRIRGLQPWPLVGALLHGKRVSFLRSAVIEIAAPAHTIPGTVVAAGRDGIDVSTGVGTLRLLALQPEGKPVMTVRDFLNGRRVGVGDRFDPLPFTS